MNNLENSLKFYIIITTYNTEKYLSDCINSILDNTYSNYEIILTDDGSTDNSLEICKEYSQKDKRIKFFSQPNQGVASIRNNALEYTLKIIDTPNSAIHFIDGDDYLSKDYYQYVAASMKKNNAEIITTAYYNEFTGYFENSPNLLLLGTLGRLSANSGLMKGAWAFIFHSSFIKKYPNLKFRKDIAIGKDTIFINEALLQASRVAVESNAIYYYRYNENSLTKKEKTLEQLRKLKLSQIETGNKLEEDAKRYNVPAKTWNTYMAQNFAKQTLYCKDLISNNIFDNEPIEQPQTEQAQTEQLHTTAELPEEQPQTEQIHTAELPKEEPQTEQSKTSIVYVKEQLSTFEKVLLKICWIFIWNKNNRKNFRKKINAI